MVGNPQKKKYGPENDQQNNSRHFERNGNMGNFVSEMLWELCSFVWEVVEDKDMKSWEMVVNLLISKVWEPCPYI